MKRKSLHLKRFAATSLCLVMCLSALPMLAPSASAAGDATPLGSSAGGGQVCINFDDGYRDVYDNAYPVLAGYGITATAFIVTDWIGGAGMSGNYMDADELLTLQAAGWEIGSHGLDHTRFSQLSYADALDQFSASKAALESIGIDCDNFAYPYGVFNATLVRAGAEIYDKQRLTFPVGLYVTEYPVEQRVIGSITPSSLAHVQAVVEHAIRTDTAVVLLYHHVDETGLIDESTDAAHTIQNVAAYLAQMRESYGLEIVNYRDIRAPPTAPSDVPLYVWDGEGDDELASNPANWYRSLGGVITNDVAPTTGGVVLFDDTSLKDCTWDLDASLVTPRSFVMDSLYGGTITQTGVDFGVGVGGFHLLDGEFRSDNKKKFYCAGDLINTYGKFKATSLSLVLTGQDNTLYIRFANSVFGAVVQGNYAVINSFDTYSGTDSAALVVEPHASLTLGYDVTMRTFQRGAMDISGTINGPGTLMCAYRINDLGISGTINAPLVIRGAGDVTIEMPSDMFLGSSLTIDRGGADTNQLVLDLDAHDLRCPDGLTVGVGGTLRGGSGMIYTSTWDSTAGIWSPEASTVVLADGGSARLAPGQSFNRLEISSDDGRTASWNMIAFGAQAPIVTGLDAGKGYIWSIDGVEQGEVKADEHGTIALSYQSTGLHTIEVKPTSMTVAMDGLYQAVGIVAVLAVLGGLITMVGRLKF